MDITTEQQTTEQRDTGQRNTEQQNDVIDITNCSKVISITNSVIGESNRQTATSAPLQILVQCTEPDESQHQRCQEGQRATGRPARKRGDRNTGKAYIILLIRTDGGD